MTTQPPKHLAACWYDYPPGEWRCAKGCPMTEPKTKEQELREALTDFVALAESAPADFDRVQVWIDRDLFVNAMRALDLAFCPKCNGCGGCGEHDGDPEDGPCSMCGGSGMLPIVTGDVLAGTAE